MELDEKFTERILDMNGDPELEPNRTADAGSEVNSANRTADAGSDMTPTSRADDLVAMLRKYPAISLAGPAENAEILEFFDKSSISGQTLKLRYIRSPDFFRFLKYRAPVNYVFAGRTTSRSISGIAAYSFNRAYINGAEETICYLGDLRAEFNRETAVSWRDLYGEILLNARNLPGLGGCRYFFTAIIDDNQTARRTLVDRSNNPFVYRELCKYKMVNIVRRKPWAGIPSPPAPYSGRGRRSTKNAWGVRRAEPLDLEQLTAFLAREARLRQFGPAFTSELPRRLSEWNAFSLGSFFIHENAEGQIDGCVAPWSPAPAKKIIVEEIPPSMRAFRAAMGLFGRGVPGPGEELEISYLTHFQISSSMDEGGRGKIFEELLSAAYRERPGILGYCDFECDSG
ncbi:MAG: hypothetical protein ABL958_11370, partial [Bdellovibrionia bacterium]